MDINFHKLHYGSVGLAPIILRLQNFLLSALSSYLDKLTEETVDLGIGESLQLERKLAMAYIDQGRS